MREKRLCCRKQNYMKHDFLNFNAAATASRAILRYFPHIHKEPAHGDGCKVKVTHLLRAYT
eukprot:4468729-Amphidinium_carterae.1